MQNAETGQARPAAEAVSRSPFLVHNSSFPARRWVIFLALALAALAIRLPQLGARPMHTDEAVNAYITGQLLAGEKYHYDPKDRHGPVLYLFAKPVAELCGARNFAGLTETELRLSPVIVGAITVLMFGAGVELFGFIPCLIAALLFAVAPLPVYYSRYFIHETSFVAATLGLILSGGHAMKNNSVVAAVLAGLCAALMLACKETAVIHFFALAVASSVVWIWSQKTRHVSSPSPRRGAGRGAEADDLKIERPRPDRLSAWVVRGSMACLFPVKIFVAALLTFLVATTLLFTWFGQDWSALADLLRAIPHLAERAGGQGHEKSFAYYFSILDPQFVFFIIAAAGIYVVICDTVAGTRRAGLLLVIYGLLIFVIYSAIPYKTPWLALNFWLPVALLCGLGVEGIWLEIKNIAGRWIAAVAIAALLLVAGQQTKTLAFDRPADERNPLAYAHTTDDILGLPARLAEICHERKLAAPRIAVVATDAWPLPWYLRKFSQVGYWQPGQETGPADLFITTADVSGKLADELKDWRPEFFGLRPGELIVLWSPLTDNKVNSN